MSAHTNQTIMPQTAIPYVFLRGGTSRGPYFRREHLPADEAVLAQVLVAAIGSGHTLNIDGIGGGAAVTTKVAMLSPGNDEWADVDYFFAQVSVIDRLVDFKPTCGNILSGVGPAAIEMGIINPTADVTEIKIRSVNTGIRVIASVQTPAGRLTYDGDTAIDGVPGNAAAVNLTFLDCVGSSTGAFLPTGNLRDEIDDIELTCMDVAMPMAIARAEHFGLSGYETVSELDANREFFDRMESVRRRAGELMGMGDVSESVTPKFGLLSKARAGGTISARYFMPWSTHPSMAVTGAQCLACCSLTPGTIAAGLLQRPHSSPATVTLEHPAGSIEVLVRFSADNGFELQDSGLVRTARKLADGHVYVPGAIWS